MMDAAPPVFLAVDSGGTKTQACIANVNGDIIGTGIAGPSNYAALGPVEWTAVIMEAIRGAKRETKGRFARAWIGSAGVTCNTDEKEAAAHIASTLCIPLDTVQVTNDTQLLCTHLATKGIVVIAGTGSVVQAFQKDTHGLFAPILRVGGLGPLLGDEGGGFGVGREALRAVLYEEPGTERLLAAILDSWHLVSKEELLAASYAHIGKFGIRATQSHIAALTPVRNAKHSVH
ncbi:hypothetical protein MVES_002707 [Malassezia vespertilionis]|uniref:N-acetyl-D-glucosamine kinase n=1 Tax=Malassezia vespertilionis TaxID=2020962 RepID=A0A2N1JAJ7_9BASI|nr:hypothetical protein MVES_002707 [Malassezia vespertilionis]